jgi:hypothetical protein
VGYARRIADPDDSPPGLILDAKSGVQKQFSVSMLHRIAQPPASSRGARRIGSGVPHSCKESVTLKVQCTVTFHLATRLSSTTASTLTTLTEWIPVIVTLARVTANCTASSIELAEMPVNLIVFSTIAKSFRVRESGWQPVAGRARFAHLW